MRCLTTQNSTFTYVIFGLPAATVTAFAGLAPPILIQAVAGPCLGRRLFLVTASGVTFAGISGAFWGLLAGGLMLGLASATKRFRAQLRRR